MKSFKLPIFSSLISLYYTHAMASTGFPLNPHPLDPLHAEEVRLATKILLRHVKCDANQLKFKVVDLAEPPKNMTYQHLYNNGPIPDRKTRIYYHLKDEPVLYIAIVNLTKETVERSYDAPDSQGPVDWVEYDLVHKACLSHPKVLEEVKKLNLPAG